MFAICNYYAITILLLLYYIMEIISMTIPVHYHWRLKHITKSLPISSAGEVGEGRLFKQIRCYCRRVVQKILLNTIVHILNNMTQMLQVSKNSNIKYNIIHVKTKPKRIYQIAKLD